MKKRTAGKAHAHTHTHTTYGINRNRSFYCYANARHKFITLVDFAVCIDSIQRLQRLITTSDPFRLFLLPLSHTHFALTALFFSPTPFHRHIFRPIFPILRLIHSDNILIHIHRYFCSCYINTGREAPHHRTHTQFRYSIYFSILWPLSAVMTA